MKTRLTVLVLTGLLVVACITINVYFPEAAIKDLSEQIEEQVRKKAADEGSAPGADQVSDMGWLSRAGEELLVAVVSLGASTAWAEEDQVPAPEITNPAIRKIIDSRAERLEAINRYKEMGVIGESNKALIEIRSLDDLQDLKQRAEVQRLVKAENADREQLFKEIASAEGVDPSQLPRIQETYAGTMRDQARVGDWIQLEDGSWQQKRQPE